ncbi:MAG TPA: YjgB family protein [Sporosarcina psychrophila]|uniref:YjgB family protein n=1 Tax=Sporosarcina psychrophila TaxID=1476 RepID=A0A921FWS5_SPOPS|nr:YjgB family protein [Sporosarcina psychrophila]
MIKSVNRKSIGWAVSGIIILVLFNGCASADEEPDEKNNNGTISQGETDKKGVPNAGKQNGESSRNQNFEETSEVTDMHVNLIKEIYRLAKEGKVPGADFISGKDLIDKVHASWGEPDKPIGAGDPYEGYSPGAGRGEFAFGIGRGEVIYDIRSFGSSIDPSVDFSKISFEVIKQTLGNPAAIRKNDKDDILLYEVGEYELKFVGPHESRLLHHISVYSPKAAAPMGG